MSIDFMYFGSAHLKERRHDKDVAVICDCGKATVNHTMRERRSCEQDAA